MYIFYCAVGRALWDVKIFGIVLLLGQGHHPDWSSFGWLNPYQNWMKRALKPQGPCIWA
jgi:hypothetical protein